jgi:hypothetical protein
MKKQPSAASEMKVTFNQKMKKNSARHLIIPEVEEEYVCPIKLLRE